MRPSVFLFCAILLWGSGARAEDLSFEPNTAFWSSGTARHVVEVPYNSGNLLARAPRDTETLEVRPDWKLKGALWKLTARPRLHLTRESVKAGGQETSSTLALLRWSEGFASYSLSEALSLDYGLQNFQWGPAESASPSNRLFRDTVQVKDSLYLVRGQHLVRFTYSPSSSFSEVLLLEPTGNGEGEPEPNEPHSLKAALKSELSWAGGADFAGFVAGWRDRSGWWMGEYVNVEVLSGLFTYLDASHQAGNLAYYPKLTARTGLVSFAQTRRTETSWNHFAASGLRYAFENGNDWRVEYIYQSAGYSTEELGRATGALGSRDALQLALLATQAPAVKASGLDFPSRHYLFTSIRFPNSFGIRDWTWYLRGLESLQDHSVSAFASSENALGEHGTFIAGLAATFGRDGAELKGAVNLAGTLAYRHAW